jgi:hypothetical protein
MPSKAAAMPCIKRIGLARVHLITGEPEQAATLIGQALPLTGERAPGRVGRKLGDFYREAGRWAAVPEVRDAREQLRSLLLVDQRSGSRRRECRDARRHHRPLEPHR